MEVIGEKSPLFFIYMTEFRTIRRRGPSRILSIPSKWKLFKVGDGVKMELSEDGKSITVTLIG